jgi:hypothetical protein
MIRGWIPEDLAFERHRRWWAAETGEDEGDGADIAAPEAPAQEGADAGV